MRPFLDEFKERHGKYPAKAIADSGYRSEENYGFLEQKKSFRNNRFLVQNLYYNPQGGLCHMCPMGQHMEKTGSFICESDNGYKSNVSTCQAKNCTGCPLRFLCHKAKDNRIINVNHNLNRLRNKGREHLTSEEGMMQPQPASHRTGGGLRTVKIQQEI